MRTSSPKIDWKTKAVTAKDPQEFSLELQRALQELTDGDYKIVNQLIRGDALVITGQKVDMSVLHSPRRLDAVTVPPPGGQRRIVASAAPSEKVTEEVLYHYREFGVQKQRSFATLVEALRLVKEHIFAPGDIVPISITCITLATFEPSSWPGLFKAFEDALEETPNKPLG